MTLNQKTRYLWAEKTFELTNIGTGALLFAQFISDREFSFTSALAGFALLLIGYLASLYLLKGK